MRREREIAHERSKVRCQRISNSSVRVCVFFSSLSLVRNGIYTGDKEEETDGFTRQATEEKGNAQNCNLLHFFTGID